MNIAIYQPGEIPADIVSLGRLYIIRRFRQVWGVDRSSEITNKSITQRTNVVAFKGNSLIGWMGLNSDWELVNGCAGPDRSGPIFSALLHRLFNEYPHKEFYAYVPIEYLACAYLCIKAGMRVPSAKDGLIMRRAYGGRILTLVKLIIPIRDGLQVPISHEEREQSIHQLHKVIDELLDVSPLAKISFLLQKLWKSISSDHSARHAVDMCGSLSMFLGASFLYYNFFVATIGGHSIPKYYDFLSNKKPELDRRELQQYLKITEKSLKLLAKLAVQNKRVVDDMVKRSTSLQLRAEEGASKAKAGAGAWQTHAVDDRLKVLKEKQVASLELIHHIVKTYSDEIDAGHGIGRKPHQLYAAVLQYMSEDQPYPNLINMLSTSEIRMDDNDLDDFRASCRINHGSKCDESAAKVIKKFVMSNER